MADALCFGWHVVHRPKTRPRHRVALANETASPLKSCAAPVTKDIGGDMSQAEIMFKVAKQWCEQNRKWTRICDIEDSGALALTWEELPRIE